MADQGTSKPAATPPSGDADKQAAKEQKAREAEEKRQADMVKAVEEANKKPVPGSEEES